MIRTLSFVFAAVLLVGCVSSRDAVPVAPLQPIGPGDGVRDLLARARIQATNATEAYFLDDWGRLDAAGQTLGETAVRLGELPVPQDRQAELRAAADRLGAAALALRQAAKKKDADAVNGVLPKIGNEVRGLQATFGAVVSEYPPTK